MHFSLLSPQAKSNNMKRLGIIGLLLLFAGTVSQAQNRNTYQDDIYFSSSDARKDAEKKAAEDQKRNSQRRASERDDRNDDYYDNNGNDNSNARIYDSKYDNGRTYEADEYVDYDDDYYYSTQMNRFGYNSFYNRPYYSAFNNPYWYDPFWVDPYWGWSPWYRPAVTVGVGFGGPYWSSYWGWQSWWGYGSWGSYWYPGPAVGFGWGYSPWWGGGYYSGYWNGYYAGMYGGGWRGGYGRSVTYGPRYSMNNMANSMRTPVSSTTGTRGLRTTMPTSGNNPGNRVERTEFRRSDMNTGTGEGIRRNDAGDRQSTVRDNGNFNTVQPGGAPGSDNSIGSGGVRTERPRPRFFNSGSSDQQIAPTRDNGNIQESAPIRREDNFNRPDGQQMQRPDYNRGNSDGNAPRQDSRPSRSFFNFNRGNNGGNIQRSEPERAAPSSRPIFDNGGGRNFGGGNSVPRNSGGGGGSRSTGGRR